MRANGSFEPQPERSHRRIRKPPTPTLRSIFGWSIGLIGVTIVVLSLPPVVNSNGARTRSDIQRAFKPFANLSLDEIADGREHSMSFVVPTDPPWKRIQRRLGKTVFLPVVSTGPQSTQAEAFSAREVIGARARSRDDAQVTDV